jgi:hypothetical protein
MMDYNFPLESPTRIRVERVGREEISGGAGEPGEPGQEKRNGRQNIASRNARNVMRFVPAATFTLWSLLC